LRSREVVKEKPLKEEEKRRILRKLESKKEKRSQGEFLFSFDFESLKAKKVRSTSGAGLFIEEG
jgi:hypothetical protein